MAWPAHAASKSEHCSLSDIFGYHLGRFREAFGECRINGLVLADLGLDEAKTA